MNQAEMNREIGRRLKSVREYRMLTQRQVAKTLNFQQQVVSQYEQGKRNISIGLLMKFCEILNVPLGYFDIREEFVIKNVEKHPESPEHRYFSSKFGHRVSL